MATTGRYYSVDGYLIMQATPDTQAYAPTSLFSVVDNTDTGDGYSLVWLADYEAWDSAQLVVDRHAARLSTDS